VIEAHAGRIWYASRGEGQGSTFAGWLPFGPATTEAEGAE